MTIALQDLQQDIQSLPEEAQNLLFDFIQILKKNYSSVTPQTEPETFWEMTQRLRETMIQEGIVFEPEDFMDLRDRSVGREVDL